MPPLARDPTTFIQPSTPDTPEVVTHPHLVLLRQPGEKTDADVVDNPARRQWIDPESGELVSLPTGTFWAIGADTLKDLARVRAEPAPFLRYTRKLPILNLSLTSRAYRDASQRVGVGLRLALLNAQDRSPDEITCMLEDYLDEDETLVGVSVIGGNAKSTARTIVVKADAIDILRRHGYLRTEPSDPDLSPKQVYSRLERLHLLTHTLHNWDQQIAQLCTVLSALMRRPLPVVGAAMAVIVIVARATDVL